MYRVKVIDGAARLADAEPKQAWKPTPLERFEAGEYVCLLSYDKRYHLIQDEYFCAEAYAEPWMRSNKNICISFVLVRAAEEYAARIAEDQKRYARLAKRIRRYRETPYRIKKREKLMPTWAIALCALLIIGAVTEFILYPLIIMIAWM